MELRTLGRTGLRVSAVGFGCGSVGGLMVRGDQAEQRRAVARAIEAGFRYFDTAPSYGDGRSEENLGRVLADLGSDAAEVIVGTKVRVEPALAAGGDASAAVMSAIRESIEASLRRLRRERVHLLQLHTRIVEGPGNSGSPDGSGGSGQPDAEGAAGRFGHVERAGAPGRGGLTAAQVLGPVVDGLRAIQAAGSTDHIGITAMGHTAAVRRVIEAGAVDTAQVYFNALNPSAGWAGRTGGGQDFGGIINVAAAHGIGVIVIRPLAAGAVTAREERHPNAGGAGGGGMAGETYAGDVARARTLASLAAELGLEGPVELALRFALAKAGVSTVLVGFSDEAQVMDAIRWAGRGPLPPDAVDRVLTLPGRA